MKKGFLDVVLTIMFSLVAIEIKGIKRINVI